MVEDPNHVDPAVESGAIGSSLVVSLDLDGTVWFGDPSGPVKADLVVALQRSSVVIGSASDRTVTDQRRLWSAAGIEPEFIVVKNHLHTIGSRYPDRFLVHVGDRFADCLEAGNAGALFIHVDVLSLDDWLDASHLMAAIDATARWRSWRSRRQSQNEA